MNSFMFLFLGGLIAFIIIRSLLEYFCDNNSELDLEKERKLTEAQ